MYVRRDRAFTLNPARSGNKQSHTKLLHCNCMPHLQPLVCERQSEEEWRVNFGSPATRKRTKVIGTFFSLAFGVVVRTRPDPGGTTPAFVGGLIGRQVFFFPGRTRAHGAAQRAARSRAPPLTHNRFFFLEQRPHVFTSTACACTHARRSISVCPSPARSSPPAFHFACRVVWCRGQSHGRWVSHRCVITRV